MEQALSFYALGFVVGFGYNGILAAWRYVIRSSVRGVGGSGTPLIGD